MHFQQPEDRSMTPKPTYEELEQKIKTLEKAAVEARRLQVALQESEENYRQLFENSPAANLPG